MDGENRISGIFWSFVDVMEPATFFRFDPSVHRDSGKQTDIPDAKQIRPWVMIISTLRLVWVH